MRIARFILAVFAASVLPASAAPLKFIVKPGAPNEVKFTSVAQMETIVGKTTAIQGWLTADPDDLGVPVAAEFTVDMATLDTDNRIRNGHMRANHLHTDKFPFSRFALKGLTPGAPKSLTSSFSDFRAQGEFACHGVTRAIEPQISAAWSPASRTLTVIARFDVKLSDYEIPRPQFLVLKLDDTQKVEVRFTARAE